MAVTLLEKHYQFQANSVRQKKNIIDYFIGIQMMSQM